MKPKKIVVVYLLWAGAGELAVRRFVQSYKKFSAGAPHTLLIAFKSCNEEDRKCFGKELEALSYTSISVPDENKDIASYKYILESHRDHFERFLLLNTSSEIMSDNWLHLYDQAFEKSNNGVIGATGSYETNEYVKEFPNVHLRTNALYSSIDIFRSLNWEEAYNGYMFEAGQNSLYRQCLEKDIAVYVLGADGNIFASESWMMSGTFRSFSQKNILISDNRTRAYEKANCVSNVWLHVKAWQGLPCGSRPGKFFQFWKLKFWVQNYYFLSNYTKFKNFL